MKLRTMLVGMGTALMFAVTAQAATAQTCPGGGLGGGDHQIELPPDGEPCNPTTYYTPLNISVANANGLTLPITGAVENGEDYLQIGEVVEVEIDLEDVIAALKADEDNAVILAAAFGVGDADRKWGAVTADNRASGPKLTEAEYRAVANHLYVSLQNNRRATGRSDPAPNSFTRRVDAVAQAFSRALATISRSLPSMSYNTRLREYNDQGVLVREKESDFRIGGGS